MSSEVRAVRPATRPSTSARARRTTDRPAPIVGPDSVRRVALELQLGWLAGADRGAVRAALGRGDLEGALALLESERVQDPDDEDVARGIDTVCRAQEEQVVARLGGYEAVPRRVKPIEPGPDRRDGLTVLAEVDGAATVARVLQQTMLPPLRAARLLESMRRQGTLEIAPARPHRPRTSGNDEEAAASQRATPTSVVPLIEALRIMAAPDSRPPPSAAPAEESRQPRFEPETHDAESTRVIDAGLATARPPPMPAEDGLEDITTRETRHADLQGAAGASTSVHDDRATPPKSPRTPTPPPADVRSAASTRSRRVARAADEDEDDIIDLDEVDRSPRRRRSPWSPAVVLALAAAMAITAASVAVVITSRIAPPPAAQPPPTIVVQAPQPAVAAPPPAAAAPAPVADTIRVKVEATPKANKLWLDDVPMAEGAELTMQRDGRVHVIRAEAFGYKTRRVTFEAAGDVTLVIALERVLERGGDAAAGSGPAAPVPPPRREPTPAAPALSDPSSPL